MIARSSSAARAGVNAPICSARHRGGMHDRRLAGRARISPPPPPSWPAATPAPPAGSAAAPLPPAAAPAPGSSCPAPCRRRGKRRGRAPTAVAATACRRADTGAACRAAQDPDRHRRRRASAVCCSVSASQGPAVTLRPVGDGDIAHRIVDRGAGQHAHGRGEAQTFALRQLLGLAELPDRALEALAIDLHPLAAQQHQRVGAGQQRGDLLLAQRLAVQRHVHVEVQHAFEPERRGLARADGAGHLRPRRTVGAPRRRHAHDDPGTFQVGHAGKQA